MWALLQSAQTPILDATSVSRGDAVVAKWWPRTTEAP
jgi:hypothetical protein